jgi:hypothetical protein
MFKFTGRKPKCNLKEVCYITQNEPSLPALAFHFISISLWLYSPYGPWRLFQFLNPIHSR